MSNEQDKFKNSKRRQKDENAVHKQEKIAKQHHLDPRWSKDVREPHRMVKRHAMDCGNPKCMLCGNPRKLWKDLTTQEKRQHQEMDIARMRHSNGLTNKDNE